MSSLTATERIRRIVGGVRPDRPAISFWRHHPRHEIRADDLVRITVEVQKRFDWDLVKINPRAEYHAEAWGNRYAFFEDEHRRPELIEPRIKSAEDWQRLEQVDPNEGVLGEHLRAVRAIREQLGPDVPIVMTVFTPLSIVAELAGVRRSLPAEFFQQAERLHAALEVVTKTFCGFVRLLIEAGCDGIFYATTRLGTRQNLTDDQFRSFSRPYDSRILAAASGGWLNVLHVCGRDAMLELTYEYPVAVFSYDMHAPSNPSGWQVVERTNRAVLGGLEAEATQRAENLEMLLRQARELLDSVGSHRAIVAAGCVLPTRADSQLLLRLRDAVRAMQS